jgi:GH24 family phage-related lysozyme (muramidase)
MSDYKKELYNLLNKHEGFSELPYLDHKGNPSIGYGFNQNSEDVKNSFVKAQVDPNAQSLTREQADRIRDILIDKFENDLKNQITPEKFDSYSPKEKAGLMSLYYNSPGLVGPNLRGYLGADDKLGAAKEVLLNSNKDNELGVLKRRLDEADMLYNVRDVGQILDPKEKYNLKKIYDSSDNDSAKKEIYDSYGDVLGVRPNEVQFNKLKTNDYPSVIPDEVMDISKVPAPVPYSRFSKLKQ